jgi:phosphopantetheine adenylyltransferase
VTNMCLLDIAPTLYMYENTNMDFVSATTVRKLAGHRAEMAR